jgi:hypothetical protein
MTGRTGSDPAAPRYRSAPDSLGGLLAASGHARTPAAVVRFTMSRDSWIGVHDAERGSTPLIELLPLPVTGAGLLAAIEAVDENAGRLVAGFRRSFPDTCRRLAEFAPRLPTTAADTPVLGWLCGAAALVLDLSEQDVELALAGGPGVRLDTVVVPLGGGHALDGRRLLRSAMSYRIAGVPGHVLARSVFESLGLFAAAAVRRIRTDWPAEVVACCGDLYAGNEILRQATRRGLAGRRVPVLMPGELPVVSLR